MIPDLVELTDAPWKVLPEGIHSATLEETRDRFAINDVRRTLFGGFLEAVVKLADAQCAIIFLNGSYVTENPYPNDYDVCWNPNGVNHTRLDPIFWEPRLRAQQKIRFLGEFFPSTTIVNETRQTFVDFFQNEKTTGKKKGILTINLKTDPMLLGD
ncbi:MAG: hypothetical protein OXO49_09055 [Gammaproteobacteria bacterium]|nr:hypothetical protein [Gammaproteobacteria bacterium]MDE0252728.1 hypothetical protein [Gammaproteobacteria bacterium]MDE0402257.1 hypothetical protein [Gammaproteobacteria bacterium]